MILYNNICLFLKKPAINIKTNKKPKENTNTWVNFKLKAKVSEDKYLTPLPFKDLWELSNIDLYIDIIQCTVYNVNSSIHGVQAILKI